MITDSRVTSFSHRQFASDDSAARMRAWRSKRLKTKETGQQCDVTSDGGVTSRPEQNRTEKKRKDTPPSATDDSHPTQTPPPGANGHANGHTRKSGDRGRRMPEDWRPSQAAIDHCLNHLEGCTPEVINRQWPILKDWALSATGAVSRKRDWDRAFINWIRRACDELREREARERRWAEQRAVKH
jgi:hypothetical protein